MNNMVASLEDNRIATKLCRELQVQDEASCPVPLSGGREITFTIVNIDSKSRRVDTRRVDANLAVGDAMSLPIPRNSLTTSPQKSSPDSNKNERICNWEMWLDPRPCEKCYQRIEESCNQESTNDLNLVLEKVISKTISTVSKCSCMGDKSQPMNKTVDNRVAGPDSSQFGTEIRSSRQILSQPDSISTSPASTDGNIVARPSSRIKVLNGSQARARITLGESERPGGSVYAVPAIAYVLSSRDKIEVTIPRPVCEVLIRHSAESNQHGREVAGILVGYMNEQALIDRNKLYSVCVTDTIPATRTSFSSNDRIHLDEDFWTEVDYTFDTTYNSQRKKRLGWYHTHPTQGIFFSAHDTDAHTVFTLPFQFALVIDPRHMEAGLFYWKNFDTKLLSGTVRFSLHCNNRNHQNNRDPVDTSSSALSPTQLFLFLFLFLGVGGLLGLMALDSEWTLRNPNVAIFAALIGFIGLRSWNTRFPARLADAVAADKPTASLGLSPRTPDSQPPPSTAPLFGRKALRSVQWIMLLVIGVLVVALAISWITDRRQETRSSAIATPSSNRLANLVQDQQHRTPASNRRTIRLMVSYPVDSNNWDSGKVILTDDRGTVISYLCNNIGKCDHPPIERQFFNGVFDSQFPKENFMKALQQALGLQQVSGQWDSATRDRFIEVALDLRNSGKPLLISLSGQDEIEVVFKPPAEDKALKWRPL